MFSWLSDTLTKTFITPFLEFLYIGNARFFWLYCATGIAIALFVHARRHTGRAFGDVFFDRETWLGRSALNDYFILFAGVLLRLTILSWAFISWEPTAKWVTEALRSIGVTGTSVGSNASIAVSVALTVSLFLVDDFLRYVVHLAMHRVPELWEIHKVHHSAEKLNFATAERFHPVETILTGAGLTLGMGVVNGVFIAFFGEHLTPLTVFGANAGLFFFNVIGGALRHAPVWVSFGDKVERWIISPSMHQIHHSENPAHYDSNMGGSLSCWDRWFGTIYYASKAEKEMTGYGIGAETADFRSLKVLYVRPLVQSLEVFGRRINAIPAPAPAQNEKAPA